MVIPETAIDYYNIPETVTKGHNWFFKTQLQLGRSLQKQQEGHGGQKSLTCL
jgi:hypothetical protein